MNQVLRLKIPNKWDAIEEVREKVDAFLAGHPVSGADRDAITMTACELTENAVKYSGQPDAAGWVEIEVAVEPDAVTVEVRHPITEQEVGNLKRLDQMVQWIRGHQDPFEAYMTRLQEVSGQSIDHPESGLGLVRIAYEGQAILDFFVDDQDILAVSAVHAL